ncbi:MAG: hypothetical protein AAFX85_02590, partial [Pseudomonadota bacterium]
MNNFVRFLIVTCLSLVSGVAASDTLLDFVETEFDPSVWRSEVVFADGQAQVNSETEDEGEGPFRAFTHEFDQNIQAAHIGPEITLAPADHPHVSNVVFSVRALVDLQPPGEFQDARVCFGVLATQEGSGQAFLLGFTSEGRCVLNGAGWQ